jgi:hypothetical protein
MPGKQTEVRVDPADGKEYALTAFLEFYGEDEGQRRWATAGQLPAYTGMPCCVPLRDLYRIKFVQLNGIKFSCMVRFLVQNQPLGK